MLVLALASAFMYSIFYNTFWGGPIAKFKPQYAASVALPYVVAAVYAYAICWPEAACSHLRPRISDRGARSGLALPCAEYPCRDHGVAILWVCCIRQSLSCAEVWRDYGAMAGFLMVIEAVFTLKFGTIDPSSVKDQDQDQEQEQAGARQTWRCASPSTYFCH